MARKFSRRTLVLVLLPVVLWLAAVSYFSSRRRDLPEPAIVSSKHVAVLARGKYLVEGPGACLECHADPAVAAKARVDPAGFPSDTPLSGGRAFDLPLGTYYAGNLTKDVETGLGALTPPQIAQSIRYSVSKTHRVLPQIMRNQDLADDDLTAIVSYLRAQPATRHEVPQPGWKPFSGIRLAMLSPAGPSGTPPQHVEPGPTVEYGRYLAYAVADCYGCHTNQDLVDGRIVGEPFAGGVSTASTSEGKEPIVSPNITPDPTYGKLAGLTEDAFLAKFRSTTHPERTSMPWTSFRKMRDDDLRALFRFLSTVKPVASDPTRSRS